MTRLLLAGCAAYAATWVWATVALPSRVPLHFDAAGTADRWGTRTQALLFFAALGVGMALLLQLGVRSLRRSRWALVNVPHKAWWTATPERQQRLRARLGRDLDVLGLATMLLLSVVLLGTVSAARGPEPTLPGWFLIALAGYLLGVLGWVVWCYAGRYRPDREAGSGPTPT